MMAGIKRMMVFLLIPAFLLTAGCMSRETDGQEKDEQTAESGQESLVTRQPVTGIANESAKDSVVDLPALKAENPDIFAWLYIPGTDIDTPVLQSECKYSLKMTKNKKVKKHEKDRKIMS